MPKVISILFLMAIVSTPTYAQDAGTDSPFSMGFGARELALGSAAIAAPDEATAVYWNPASLALSQHLTVGTFHTQLFESDVVYQFLGVAYPTLDFGTLSLGIAKLGINNIEKRDANNLRVGTFDDSRLGVFLGYGKTVAGYQMGVGFNIEHHSLSDYSSTSSPGLSLSVSKEIPLYLRESSHITLTANARNIIGPTNKLADESVTSPALYDFGIAADIIPPSTSGHAMSLYSRIAASGDAEKRYAVGSEYSLKGVISVRAGVHSGNLSGGIGLDYRFLGFDYAIIERDYGTLHMFNLSMCFGTSITDRRVARDQRRELEFQQRMSETFEQRNVQLIDQLIDEARREYTAGNLDEAMDAAERALFLAEGSRVEKTEISRLVVSIQRDYLTAQRQSQMAWYLDSATVSLRNNDPIISRYFAKKALELEPENSRARALLGRIDSTLAARASIDQVVLEGIAMADSLTMYGTPQEALVTLSGLLQLKPEDKGIKRALNRTEFEYWKNRASQRMARGNLSAAEAALDSALVRFPDHPWCVDLQKQINSQRQVVLTSVAETTKEEASELSAAEIAELESAYKQGQQLLADGNWLEAVGVWETVEQRAPGFESVRDYLVEAYKFIGVEHYTKNELAAALKAWKRASEIEPENREIARFIERTQNELNRLQELSYDDRASINP